MGKAAILCPLFIIVAMFCFVFAALKSKFPQKTAAAVMGAACGMTVNITGETLWKTVQYYLAGSSFEAAISGAVLSQGSTLINAAIAIVGGVSLFLALEKPFRRILNK